MLPPEIERLLAMSRSGEAWDSPNPDFKQAARTLFEAPDLAARLLRLIAARTDRGQELEDMIVLLSSALDEARMARENGRQRGDAFIATLEASIVELSAPDALTFMGRMALASSWGRAGLQPPEALAERVDLADAPEMVDFFDGEAQLDALLTKLAQENTDGGSMLQSGFLDMLATLPAALRRALVRQVTQRPERVFGDVACALLLDRRAEVRQGAAEGLGDRLAAGAMGAELLARLTVLRSWIEDAELRPRVDALIAEAMRKGIGGPVSRTPPKIHRILSSRIDGSGAQSLSIALQSGSTRRVAVVLLKQGFGVKDAYVIPCSSATEQRSLLDTIAEGVDVVEVPSSYLAQAIALGLGDGLRAGSPPPPGLVDVVQAVGLDALRPLPADIAAIFGLIDPEGTLADLSPQARGRLINTSRDWAEDHPMVATSWYEDSDAFTGAIEGAATPAAMKRALWSALERRRDHWAAVIARSGLLLQAAGAPEARAFAAVALALAEGRELKKVPVMETVFAESFHVWAYEQARSGAEPPSGKGGPHARGRAAAPRGGPIPGIAPERPGELGKLLRPAGLTEWWVDGYMAGVCTAPRFIPPGVWLHPLMNIIGPEIEDERKLERILELLLGRYNEMLTRLRTPVGVVLLPGDEMPLSIWADGYLTAWEGNPSHWPANDLDAADGTARALLEAAAGGRLDTAAMARTLPPWLRDRFHRQASPA